MSPFLSVYLRYGQHGSIFLNSSLYGPSYGPSCHLRPTQYQKNSFFYMWFHRQKFVYMTVACTRLIARQTCRYRTLPLIQQLCALRLVLDHSMGCKKRADLWEKRTLNIMKMNRIISVKTALCRGYMWKNDFEIILKLFQCFVSHVTTSETEIKLFQPLKEF